MADPNEVRIPIVVTGEDQADRDLKKVEKAVEGVADALDDMGGSATGATKASDKAGGSFRDTADEAGHLSRQAAEAAANIKRLVAELDRTGDKTLKKDIRGAKRDRNEALSLLKELTPDPTQVAATAGQSFTSGIATALKAGGPAVKGAAIGLGILVTPVIGAAISAAILGGVGAGGLVGGIALAARDPAVKTAAEDLSSAVSAGFSQSASPFVQPLVDSLDQLSTTGVNAAEALKPGFDALSGTIGPLTDGIDGLVDGGLPGLTSALKAAAPVVRVLANELPGLGEDLGDALETFSEDPDGAVLAVKALVDGTGKAAKFIASTASTLSSIYENTVRFGASATGVLEDIFGAVDFLPITGMLADTQRRANDDLEGLLEGLNRAKQGTSDLAVTTSDVVYVTRGLGVAAEGTAEALNAQRVATDALVEAELSSINAAIAAERAIDGLAEAREENGTSLDIDTEKGRRNTEAILDGIEAVKEGAKREYDLAIAHGATVVEAEKAAAAYRDKYGKELSAQIIKLYGNTKGVKDLLAELDKLNGKRITYTLVQRGGRTIGIKDDRGLQTAGDEGVYRRAGGGGVQAGRTYWVGENGPELVTMGENGWVHTAADSQRMMAGTAAAGPTGGAYAAGGAAAAVPAVPQFRIVVEHPALQWLAQFIRVEVDDALQAEAMATAGGPR